MSKVLLPNKSDKEIDKVNKGKSVKNYPKTDSKQYASGFSHLALPFSIMKGLHFMGYCQPTPIQNESIPALSQGRDIVAMARTGSGKTAAFIIPLLMKLNCTHSARVGARAIVIAPTRELASQISTFVESLCKKANLSLRTACFLGGDSISEQFSILLSNPDILIGTPGRLLHLLAEISSSSKESLNGNVFSAVQMVILDEADRLFEDPASSAQVSLLFSRFPKSRQIGLFSATMPAQLLAFSKTDLKDPMLIRLDTESQLSKNLKLIYFDAQMVEKPAMLLSLLEKRSFFSFSTNEPGGMIFVATRHIAEFLSGILSQSNIKHGVLFGQMDQEARTIVLGSFRSGALPLLIVTDIASRGLDIPSLQFIINYDFPPTPKLFIHRAGRVARAGRSGTAISFISIDERPFLIELGSFQGVQNIQLMRLVPPGDVSLEEIKNRIESFISANADLGPLSRSATQSLLKYQRTRPKASPISYSKAKLLPSRELLPLYEEQKNGDEAKQKNTSYFPKETSFMAQLAAYRPSETVFEAMRKGTRGQRSVSLTPELASIAAIRNKKKQRIQETKETPASTVFTSDVSDLSFKDDKVFVDYEKIGGHFERGLNVATFSFLGDEQRNNSSTSFTGKKRPTREWDAKKKRFVQKQPLDSPEITLEKVLFGPKKTKRNPNDKKKEIGEIYSTWKKQTHQELPRIGAIEDTQASVPRNNRSHDYRRNNKKKPFTNNRNISKNTQHIKSELKKPEQIIKARSKKAAMAERISSSKKTGRKKR